MTIARIAQDSTGRGGRRNGARGWPGVGGVASGNSQFDNDRRFKHLWNGGVVAADVRLTAGKVLLDQSMLAGEPVPHRSRVTPVSWSCRFVAGSGRGRSWRHEVGLRPANCLVDCRRNGEIG